MEHVVLYLRSWQIMIYEFGTYFFRMPDSHNDINVLQRSPVFSRLAEGQASECNYAINGHLCDKGHYLADSIYQRAAPCVTESWVNDLTRGLGIDMLAHDVIEKC